ncbi:bifunctional [glutamate--ammonia ligase]-adenylyl-L-tyrosine phosphorylase/[glutamate--ammonia-ligase] adenylyltransferase [Motiliproteus sp. MSK22-1]|uniref:bifunctional [glutamate--ammonia ligase]-adenylyl-L-tyrosine phosphorylase/[glutamate--ammonia-ligase] adenylyltransferase n=1 Tax=Motiliproteus sp. MSK22-1 TaxID=1897630 RepID=UPI0009755946|nr:bifunctional [glutamate--ammonia ligase]-adenylyl-L-tyrosine phosphorylase/[glutamate--ammonia-ligase] adenylyltransferase [Motiliproteus sp. MSK22-1]OMH28005.1 bifunctional glutamine synthetase adenylyltransferase/deadenyltransferase [Motiliproteus sp. MSK22-1]
MQGPVLDSIPSSLKDAVERHWQNFVEAADEKVLNQLNNQPVTFWQQLSHVWACSDFVAGQCTLHPLWLTGLLDDLQQSYAPGHLHLSLRQQLSETETELQLHSQLRKFRNREMIRIIWRDLNREAPLEETTRDLSELADACTDQALQWLYRWACGNWGTPYSRGSLPGIAGDAMADAQPVRPQQMVILGMGKLGAQELNLSSDIDLIFAFPENGETQGGKRSLDNQTFFNRLGQKLIQALDNNTADGFVFRVDMRLRPYGQSGILAPCFAAMEEYYQDQGRDWERYAMIKARVVAGDQQMGAQLLETLRPFVYRKYLDFSAFDSLRKMKEMINREVRRKNLQGNVKLGSGGIREVEFIAQAFQLIRGGRDSRLQQRELRKILKLLPDAVGMPVQAADELLQAYRFLRNSEHAIQAFADQQTQELPIDEVGQIRLAFAMGFDDWKRFLTHLNQQRQRVEHHFSEVIAPVQEAPLGQQQSIWQPFWSEELEGEDALAFLQQQGHEEPAEALRLIDNLRNNRKVEVMQQIGRERLDNLMPLLLERVAQCEMPTRTLERVLRLVESVLRRSAYFVLLIENPGALAQLVKLCSSSSWFADTLSKQPILLDELIDVQSLYSPPDKKALQDELRQQLLRIPEEDTEQLMEVLRYFKNAHVLRVAAAEISGALPLMKVSDYLTFIAEVVLEGALDIAWRMLTEKHGTPQREPGVCCDPDFIVVGYGKVGGIELSYGSDLDLVFIHDGAVNLPTDGPKPIDCQVFFTRLGQRIIHILNTATTSGQLYEVDMRLRPSGNSGLLVSSLKAFRDYQLKEAWTWEHQALVRARVVAGCSGLAERFEQVRAEVLCQQREEAKLRQEVLDMRLKMREHLGSKSPTKEGEPGVFHLKQDSGGIVDIEFLVQYFALAFAADKPELITYTDNIRILDAVEQTDLLPQEQAELLREAYKSYRSVGHHLALQEKSSLINDQEMKELREAVAKIWDSVLRKG